jgi:conjugal transfer pilus assembly protein TraV
VVRLWLAPWEDSDGDLNMGGFILTEVAGKKRWVLGEKILDLDSRMTPRLISPLLQKKEEDVKEKPDGKDKGKGRGDESDRARNPGNIGRPKGPGPP